MTSIGFLCPRCFLGAWRCYFVSTPGINERLRQLRHCYGKLEFEVVKKTWCACVSVGGGLQRDLGACSGSGSVPEWLLDALTGRFPQHLLCCQVCQSYFLDQSCSISFFFLKRVFCCSCLMYPASFKIGDI